MCFSPVQQSEASVPGQQLALFHMVPLVFQEAMLLPSFGLPTPSGLIILLPRLPVKPQAGHPCFLKALAQKWYKPFPLLFGKTQSHGHILTAKEPRKKKWILVTSLGPDGTLWEIIKLHGKTLTEQCVHGISPSFLKTHIYKCVSYVSFCFSSLANLCLLLLFSSHVLLPVHS